MKQSLRSILFLLTIPCFTLFGGNWDNVPANAIIKPQPNVRGVDNVDCDLSGTDAVADALSKACVLEDKANDIDATTDSANSKACVLESKVDNLTVLIDVEKEFDGTFTLIAEALSKACVIEEKTTDLDEVSDSAESKLCVVESKVGEIDVMMDLSQEFNDTFTALEELKSKVCAVEDKTDDLDQQSDDTLSKLCVVDSVVDALDVSIDLKDEFGGTYTALSEVNSKLCVIDEVSSTVLDVTQESVSKACVIESKIDAIDVSESLKQEFTHVFTGIQESLSKACVLEEKETEISTINDDNLSKLCVLESKIDNLDVSGTVTEEFAGTYTMLHEAISKLCVVDEKVDVVTDVANQEQSKLDIIHSQLDNLVVTVDLKEEFNTTFTLIAEALSKLCVVEDNVDILDQVSDETLSKLCVLESKVDNIDISDDISSEFDIVFDTIDETLSKLCVIEDNMNIAISEVDEIRTEDFGGTFTALDAVFSKVCEINSNVDNLTESVIDGINEQLSIIESISKEVMDITLEIISACDVIETGLSKVDATVDMSTEKSIFIESKMCIIEENVDNQISVIEDIRTEDFGGTFTALEEAISKACVVEEDTTVLDEALDDVFSKLCIIEGIINLGGNVSEDFTGVFTTIEAQISKECLIEDIIDDTEITADDTFSKLCVLNSKLDNLDVSDTVTAEFSGTFTALDEVLSKMCVVEDKLDEEIIDAAANLSKACIVDDQVNTVINSSLDLTAEFDGTFSLIAEATSKACVIEPKIEEFTQTADETTSKLCVVESKVEALDVSGNVTDEFNSVFELIEENLSKACVIDDKVDDLNQTVTGANIECLATFPYDITEDYDTGNLVITSDFNELVAARWLDLNGDKYLAVSGVDSYSQGVIVVSKYNEITNTLTQVASFTTHSVIEVSAVAAGRRGVVSLDWRLIDGRPYLISGGSNAYYEGVIIDKKAVRILEFDAMSSTLTERASFSPLEVFDYPDDHTHFGEPYVESVSWIPDTNFVAVLLRSDQYNIAVDELMPDGFSHPKRLIILEFDEVYDILTPVASLDSSLGGDVGFFYDLKNVTSITIGGKHFLAFIEKDFFAENFNQLGSGDHVVIAEFDSLSKTLSLRARRNFDLAPPMSGLLDSVNRVSWFEENGELYLGVLRFSFDGVTVGSTLETLKFDTTTFALNDVPTATFTLPFRNMLDFSPISMKGERFIAIGAKTIDQSNINSQIILLSFNQANESYNLIGTKDLSLFTSGVMFPGVDATLSSVTPNRILIGASNVLDTRYDMSFEDAEQANVAGVIGADILFGGINGVLDKVCTVESLVDAIAVNDDLSDEFGGTFTMIAQGFSKACVVEDTVNETINTTDLNTSKACVIESKVEAIEVSDDLADEFSATWTLIDAIQEKVCAGLCNPVLITQDDIPYFISTGGTYIVTENLEYSGYDSIITVSANDVVIDLCNMTLIGSDGATGITVLKDGVTTDRSNITIKNGVIRGDSSYYYPAGLDTGIFLDDETHNVLITNVDILDTDSVAIQMGTTSAVVPPPFPGLRTALSEVTVQNVRLIRGADGIVINRLASLITIDDVHVTGMTNNALATRGSSGFEVKEVRVHNSTFFENVLDPSVVAVLQCAHTRVLDISNCRINNNEVDAGIDLLNSIVLFDTCRKVVFEASELFCNSGAPDGMGYSVIAASSTRDSIFRELKVHANTSAAGITRGILLSNCLKMLVEDCAIYANTGVVNVFGMLFASTNNSVIKHCKAFNNSSTTGDAVGCRAINCDCNVFMDCIANAQTGYTAGIGFSLETLTAHQFIRCSAACNSTDGFKFEPTVTTSECKDCQAMYNGQYGFDLTGAAESVLLVRNIACGNGS